MRIAAAISAALHLAVFLVAWIGIIPNSRPMIVPERAVEVEVIAELEEAKPKPQPQAKPKPKPVPPPPAAPPPPPEPQIAEKPETVAIPEPKAKPPAKVKPKPKPKPKPKVEEKPKQKEKKQAQRPKPRPKSKPKPPPKHNFASVLKTVSKLEKQPQPKQPKKKPEPAKKAEAPLQQVANLLKKAQPQPRNLQLRDGLSANELDAIRRQIEPCWNLPAGARDAQSMVVEIRATVNPDGRVRTAFIADKARARSDVFYRAMAESALRAMLNPRCQPLPLPLDKYAEWRDMVIVFDPQEMF